MAELWREAVALEDDKPHEECGVFGAYIPGSNAALLAYFGIEAEQNRGTNGAGVGVVDPETGLVMVTRDVGKVEVAITESDLHGLPDSEWAIGHVRYSTVATRDMFAATQPAWEHAGSKQEDGGHIEFALSHNGHLVNFEDLSAKYDVPEGKKASDSHLIAYLIAKKYEEVGSFEGAISRLAPELIGAFTLVLLTRDKLIGLCDPNGFRPLHLGKIGLKGSVLASEVASVNAVGGEHLDEINAGEMVIVTPDAVERRLYIPDSQIEQRRCVFEAIYFSRPDNIINGELVRLSRERMGGELAAQDAMWHADLKRADKLKEVIVTSIPSSGDDAARGYANWSHLPLEGAFVKNQFSGRTFMHIDPELRAMLVRRKLNSLREVVEGKIVIAVDDSEIRGNTHRVVVQMLRDAGAAEVHLRLSSAEYQFPCYMGMDTGNPDELIANKTGIEGINAHNQADSTKFLPVESLLSAAGQKDGEKLSFCDACMTGNYPIDITQKPSA